MTSRPNIHPNRYISGRRRASWLYFSSPSSMDDVDAVQAQIARNVVPAFLSHYPRSPFAGSLQLLVSGRCASTGFYAGLRMSTCIGLFLFTRILLPEATMTFSIALALLALLRTLDEETPSESLGRSESG